MEHHNIPEEARVPLAMLALHEYPTAMVASWYQSLLNGKTSLDIDTPELIQSPTTATADAKYSCPVCWTSLRQSKDCNRHAKGHWMRYQCQTCPASYLRKDHFTRHHQKSHACAAKRCSHANEAAVITSSWVALGCGFCERCFVPELVNGTADMNAMTATHNQYMNHVIDHYKKGLTAAEWTVNQQIKSLLCQPHIQPFWSQLCTQYQTQDAQVTFDLPRNVSAAFISMLQSGQTALSPAMNLDSLLQIRLGRQIGESTASDRSDFLDLSVTMDISETPWFAPMATGFGFDPSDMLSSDGVLVTAPSAIITSSAPVDVSWTGQNLVQATELSHTTLVDTISDEIVPLPNVKKFGHRPASPVRSFTWPANHEGNDFSLTGMHSFGRDEMFDLEVNNHLNGAQNDAMTGNYSIYDQNPYLADIGSVADFDGNYLASQTEHVATGTIPSTQYNITPPILNQEFAKGHKRPLSGMSQHLKRLSRTIFHRG